MWRRGSGLHPVAAAAIWDSHRRELQFDLDTVRRQMFARDGKTAEFDIVSRSVANLVRMWADD
jgi:PKHD-type hydroxylase